MPFHSFSYSFIHSLIHLVTPHLWVISNVPDTELAARDIAVNEPDMVPVLLLFTAIDQIIRILKNT